MKGRTFFVLVSVLVLVSMFSQAALAGPSAQGGPDDQPAGSAAMAPESDGGDIAALQAAGVEIVFHDATHKVRFLSAPAGMPLSRPADLDAAAAPEQAAQAFINQYGTLFGIQDAANELAMTDVSVTEDGRGVTRYQQVYQGAPVLGGELVVQTTAANDLLSINGEAAPGLDLSIAPGVTAEAAAEKAIAVTAKIYSIDPASLQASAPELVVYAPMLMDAQDSSPSALSWRTEVTSPAGAPVREFVLIDARLGAPSLHFSQLDTAKSRLIYDNNNNSSAGLPGGTPLGTVARAEGGGASGIVDVNQAYDYLGSTYDFFFTNHGRDSIDGKGMKLVATTRFCDPSSPCPYANAFWNGSQMVFGAGYAAADDVVGHELVHGVTEHESGLFYYMQSGAINESFSDIWGEFIDLGNGLGNDTPGVRWLMGEDIPGGAIRSMSNPPAYGDPDRMQSANYYCGMGDGGGVHTNSGVGNKAAFLMADGGTFNGFIVTALGIAETADIFYEAQSNILTSAADYPDLGSALNQACRALVGTGGITTTDCANVSDAVNAVQMLEQPNACTSYEAPFCDNSLFNSQFSGSSPGWFNVTGSWSVDADSLNGSPTAGNYASVANTLVVEDYFYAARMRRTGCSSCANGLAVRGNPIPVGPDSQWTQAYFFQYTTSGSISVLRYNGGAFEFLLSWTPSPAVVPGVNWNDLVVEAEGGRMTFLINNIPVWSGTDSFTPYTQGQVGLFSYSTVAGDLIEVDYASLWGGSPLPVFEDDFENPVSGNWVASQVPASGVYPWFYPQNANPFDFDARYATSGAYNLWAYNQAATADLRMTLTRDISIPTNAYMHFSNAWEFEPPNYDGGVLEYSNNGGATWNDTFALFTNNGYTGAISGSFGNPIGGRQAFIGDSNGMRSSRLNLSSLAGQNVRFRFRHGSDNIIDAFGWFIDDVMIYRCYNSTPEIFMPFVGLSGAPVGDHHSPFNDSDLGWTPVVGTWHATPTSYATNGLTNSYSTTYFKDTYTDLTVTARVKRDGDTTANYIMLRGTPNTGGPSAAWSNGYGFGFANDGYYAVYKWVGGSVINLKPWTFNSAINTGEAYNIVKVSAIGTNLSFSINGVTLWSGTDSSLSSGKVGFMTYMTGSPFNRFWADWLSIVGSGTLSNALEQLDLAPAQPNSSPPGSETGLVK